MPARIGKIFLSTIGGIAVVGTSFWLTLHFLQNWTPGIHIIEAAYGGNCKDYKVQPPRENKFTPGNATSAVTAACGGKLDRCDFTVRAEQLGDPVPSCAKDFVVTWFCGGQSGTHEARLQGEANGRSVSIVCPKS
jgi:hypothetical protein